MNVMHIGQSIIIR